MDNLDKTIICNAEIEDIDSIVKIEKECFTDAWSWESFHYCFMSPFYVNIVARINGAIVGYGFMKSIYEDAELLRIAVSSSYRRLDIGYRILDYLINEVKNNGAEKVFLDVRKSNEAAISLYEKMGFSRYDDAIIDEIKDFDGILCFLGAGNIDNLFTKLYLSDK